MRVHGEGAATIVARVVEEGVREVELVLIGGGSDFAFMRLQPGDDEEMVYRMSTWPSVIERVTHGAARGLLTHAELRTVDHVLAVRDTESGPDQATINFADGSSITWGDPSASMVRAMERRRDEYIDPPQGSMAQQLIGALDRPEPGRATRVGARTTVEPAPFAFEGREDLYKILRTMLATRVPPKVPIRVEIALPGGRTLGPEVQGNAQLGGGILLAFEDGSAWVLDEVAESVEQVVPSRPQQTSTAPTEANTIAATVRAALRRGKLGTVERLPTAGSRGDHAAREFVGLGGLRSHLAGMALPHLPEPGLPLRLAFLGPTAFEHITLVTRRPSGGVLLEFEEDDSFFILGGPVEASPPGVGSTWSPTTSGDLTSRDLAEASRLADHLGRWVELLADDDPRLPAAEATRNSLLTELSLPELRRGMLRAIVQSGLDLIRTDVEQFTAHLAGLLEVDLTDRAPVAPPVRDAPIDEPDPAADADWSAASATVTELAELAVDAAPPEVVDPPRDDDGRADEDEAEAPGRGTLLVRFGKWASVEAGSALVQGGAMGGVILAGPWLATVPPALLRLVESLLNLVGI